MMVACFAVRVGGGGGGGEGVRTWYEDDEVLYEDGEVLKGLRLAGKTVRWKGRGVSEACKGY